MTAHKFTRAQLVAFTEVLGVTGAYILISLFFVRVVDLSSILPDALSSQERTVGAGFLAGAVIQIALVLAGAYLLRLQDVVGAIRASVSPSTREAWIIASIATLIHIVTAVFVVIPEPGSVLSPSLSNVVLSLIPAADGVTQEIVFRGYVLYRLARGGVAALPQIIVSGALFSAIHIGYTGSTLWETLFPLVGTFVLGCFFAWAVQRGNGSLKPVIVGHVIIVIVCQPWLALAR